MSVRDVVVDDHLLLRVLLDDEPPQLRPKGGRLATTGLWYHRLCRALAVPSVTGALSRSVGAAEPSVGAAAVGAVIALPSSITLISLRDLAWPMADLVAAGARLNLLSLEALAAARHLGADLCLATVDDNPALRAIAGRFGVEVRLVD